MSCDMTFSQVSVASALLVLSAISGAGASTAISIPPSSTWYGDDGSWSASTFQLGNPPQNVSLFVNTAASDIWVAGPGGCDSTSLCSNGRGGLFNSSASTTWDGLGSYELGLSSVSNSQNVVADYGLDTLVFGNSNKSLDNALVGVMNATTYWVGMVGLGSAIFQFPNQNINGTLWSASEHLGLIDASYGYTAGAYYRSGGSPSSLTLGGYDEKRFQPNDMPASVLTPAGAPQISVDTITVTDPGSNFTSQTTSFDSGTIFLIDSSTPYMWLPQSACNEIAAKLNLTFNDTLNLYTYDANPSQRDTLASMNLTFSFVLGSVLASGTSPEQLTITFPWDAFDLQLTYPYIPGSIYNTPGATKYYFPLRPAANASEYRLGRAFLQEAYITTDNTAGTFNIYQANHVSDPTDTNIIDYPEVTSASSSSPSSSPESSSSGVSIGTIIGIAFGAIASIILLALPLYFFRKRRNASSSSGDENRSTLNSEAGIVHEKDAQEPIQEMSGAAMVAEVGADASHERFELPGSMPVELADTSIGTSSSFGISMISPSRTMDSPTQPPSTPDKQLAESRRNEDSPGVYRAPDTPNSGSIRSTELHIPLLRTGGHLRSTDSLLPSPLSTSSDPHGADRYTVSVSAGTRTLDLDTQSSTFDSQRNPPPTPTTPLASPPAYSRHAEDHEIGKSSRMMSEGEKVTNGSPHGSNQGGNEGMRDRIDTSHVELVGSLPDNVSIPRAGDYPRMGRGLQLDTGSGRGSHSVSNSSSLGSQGHNMPTPEGQREDDGLMGVWGSRSRLDGEDLVHVPQVPPHRFSFEGGDDLTVDSRR